MRRLPGDSAPLGSITQQQLEAERKSTPGEGGGLVRKDQSPLKTNLRKNPEGKNRLDRGPKPPHGELRSSHVQNLVFKFRPLMIGVYVGMGPEVGWECLQVHFFGKF